MFWPIESPPLPPRLGQQKQKQKQEKRLQNLSSAQRRCGQCKKHFCYCHCAHQRHFRLGMQRVAPFQTLLCSHTQPRLRLSMTWLALLITCLPHFAHTVLSSSDEFATTTYSSAARGSTFTIISNYTATMPTIRPNTTTPTITTSSTSKSILPPSVASLYHSPNMFTNEEQHRSTKSRRSASIEIVRQNEPHNFAHHPMYMNSYLTYSGTWFKHIFIFT